MESLGKRVCLFKMVDIDDAEGLKSYIKNFSMRMARVLDKRFWDNFIDLCLTKSRR